MGWFLFVVSLAVNVVLFLYIRFLIEQMSTLAQEKHELVINLRAFESHVKNLHKNRVFYGDPLFINLMKHANDLIDYLQEYEEVYDMFESEEDLGFQEEEIYSYDKNEAFKT